MRRFGFIAGVGGLVLILGLALPATAQVPDAAPSDRVVDALVAAGYTISVQERTWLGRLRIVATKGQMRREVVLNPGTGEVLRDYASQINDGSGSGVGTATVTATLPPVETDTPTGIEVTPAPIAPDVDVIVGEPPVDAP